MTFRIRRRIVIALIAFVAVTGASTALFAQNRSAALSGIVKDSTGAVLPGATVTVRAIATNQSRETVTDEGGRYAFPNQDIGDNEVVATFPGFQTARVMVDLTVGQATQLDFALRPGNVSETVSVTGDASRFLIETHNSTFGQLVSRT